ncbi:MAG: autotransporter domain-containing protein [Akkermansia sp.]
MTSNATLTHSAALSLTNSDADSGGYALKLTDGSTQTPVSTYVFGNTVSGDGTLWVATGKNFNFLFNGNTSAWTGQYKQNAAATVNLTYAGAATNVNNSIVATAGALYLNVGTTTQANDGVTFHADTISASKLWVQSGAKAAFTATNDTATYTFTGDGGLELDANASLTLTKGTLKAKKLARTAGTATGTSFTMSGGTLELTSADGIAEGIGVTLTGGTLVANEAAWGMSDATVGGVAVQGSQVVTLTNATINGSITATGQLVLAGDTTLSGNNAALTQSGSGSVTVQKTLNVTDALTLSGTITFDRNGTYTTASDPGWTDTANSQGFRTTLYKLITGSGSITANDGTVVKYGEQQTVAQATDGGYYAAGLYGDAVYQQKTGTVTYAAITAAAASLYLTTDFTISLGSGTVLDATAQNLTAANNLDNFLKKLTADSAGTVQLAAAEYTFSADAAYGTKEVSISGYNLEFTSTQSQVTTINGQGWNDGRKLNLLLGSGTELNATGGLALVSGTTLRVGSGAAVNTGNANLSLGHSVYLEDYYGQLILSEGGQVTTGKITEANEQPSNRFEMTGGRLTITADTSATPPASKTGIDGGFTTVISGGTLDTSQCAWTINSSEATIGGVTVAGSNTLTITNATIAGLITVEQPVVQASDDGASDGASTPPSSASVTLTVSGLTIDVGYMEVSSTSTPSRSNGNNGFLQDTNVFTLVQGASSLDYGVDGTTTRTFTVTSSNAAVEVNPNSAFALGANGSSITLKEVKLTHLDTYLITADSTVSTKEGATGYDAGAATADASVTTFDIEVGGTLELGQAQDLSVKGAGTITQYGNSLSGGDMSITVKESASNITLSNVTLSSTSEEVTTYGSLTKGGEGTLTIAGTVTAAGLTTTAGNLKGNTGSALDLGDGTLTLAAGTTNSLVSLTAGQVVLGAATTLELEGKLTASALTLTGIDGTLTDALLSANALNLASDPESGLATLAITAELDVLQTLDTGDGNSITLLTLTDGTLGTNLKLTLNGTTITDETTMVKGSGMYNYSLERSSDDTTILLVSQTKGATWGGTGDPDPTGNTWTPDLNPKEQINFAGTGSSTVIIASTETTPVTTPKVVVDIAADGQTQSYTWLGDKLTIKATGDDPAVTQGELLVRRGQLTIANITEVHGITAVEDKLIIGQAEPIEQGSSVPEGWLWSDLVAVYEGGTLSVEDGGKLTVAQDNHEGSGTLNNEGTLRVLNDSSAYIDTLNSTGTVEVESATGENGSEHGELQVINGTITKLTGVNGDSTAGKLLVCPGLSYLSLRNAPYAINLLSDTDDDEPLPPVENTVTLVNSTTLSELEVQAPSGHLKVGSEEAPANLTVTGTVLNSGKITVSGTLSAGIYDSAGSITAGKLDLSSMNPSAASYIRELTTDTISGISTTTHTLSVGGLNAATEGDKVTLDVTDAAREQVAQELLASPGKYTFVSYENGSQTKLDVDDAAYLQQRLDDVNLYALQDNANGTVTVIDNSFAKLGTAQGPAHEGLTMVDEAYRTANADRQYGEASRLTGDLADVVDTLKAYRAAGDSAAANRLGEALSGASVATMGAALAGTVESRLESIRNRTTTMGVNQSVIHEKMPYVNAWINAEGDYRALNSDGSMPGYKLSSWGGTAGVDFDCTPSFTCGLAFSALYGDFDSKGTDHATGDLNTYYLTAFARYAKHRWTHAFVATAGLADTRLERTVNGVKVKGDSDGSMLGALYEVGYVFALDEEATTCLQPVFNVAVTHSTLKGYMESGSNVGLKVDDTELTRVSFGLGARMQTIVGESVYNRSSILEMRALLKADAGDREGETKVSLVGTGLPTHSVKSAESGAVGFELGAGLTVPVGGEGGNIFADASLELRADYTNVNATLGYRVNF